VCDLATAKRGGPDLSWAVAPQKKKTMMALWVPPAFPSFSDYPAAPSCWPYLAFSNDSYLFITFFKNI
jgi:hypothetical protein